MRCRTTTFLILDFRESSQKLIYQHRSYEGEEGFHLETRFGFEVDGMEIKARLDYGAGVLDFRGLYKNPGA